MSLKNIKISAPRYDAIIPSTQVKVKITPFKVMDEKVLLIASESKDNTQMVQALRDVISSCVDPVDATKLESFDLEYLFLRLRSISVGEVSELIIPCTECAHKNKVSVDISKVEVYFNEEHTDMVKISDDLMFKMKFIDLGEIANVENKENITELLGIVAKSIETVFYGEETYDIGPGEFDDVMAILEQISAADFRKLQEFFETQPKLQKEVKFKCEGCEKSNEIILEGLMNFF